MKLQGNAALTGAGGGAAKFAGTFTGATGLEPATSGVTGRSWRFRAERGNAGICSVSRALRPCRCGDSRVRAGISGCLVRDQRGMGSCPWGKQGCAQDPLALPRVDRRGRSKCDVDPSLVRSRSWARRRGRPAAPSGSRSASLEVSG